MKFHVRRFDRAAETYATHAGMQARMAEELLGLLERAAPNPGLGKPAKNILEMGCGTGGLTLRLRGRFPGGNLLVSDAAPRMLEAARHALESSRPNSPAARKRVKAGIGGIPPGEAWALFDAEEAEEIPYLVASRAPFDLAASNALAQWFPDLESHFRLVESLLAPGGRYLASAFLDGNFPELNALLREEPFGYTRFPGHSRTHIEAAAEQAGLRPDIFLEGKVETVHASPEAFLQLIKGLGSARKPEPGKSMTRGGLDLLARRYRERYACPGGVRVTWRPWYAALAKVGNRAA